MTPTMAKPDARRTGLGRFTIYKSGIRVGTYRLLIAE